MQALILIAHNLRSCHNVGSLLRTADGLGVNEVILTGYTPYPALAEHDPRLPHEATKLTKQIHKTALGAETSQAWRHMKLDDCLAELQAADYTIAAIEQADTAIPLPEFRPAGRTALLVGREVEGVEPDVLARCDRIIEIPMFGRKESFNVAQAAAMALYHCRFNVV